ncbi:MAG: tetraacyldisaccharide 4'-kinase [Deltaproteobacteria bacterium]|jgi:tetraacyldisaccharide 4'-kinase|nr:tetraacyldisaccharide 4'-kinase [Deltaproteobacteria bacterium]
MRVEGYWSRDTPPPSFLKTLGVAWGAVMARRRELYRKGVLKSREAPVPVVSVGNITVGGSGKTPMCIFLANALAERGWTPAVVSRGYGRKGAPALPDPVLVSAGDGPLVPWELSGDEPALIALESPAMVLCSRDRLEGAHEAARLGADVVILDDGFQHLKIRRDVDILMFQSEDHLGNGCVLPAGPLREPLSACADATLVCVVGRHVHPALERLAGDRPLFRLRPTPLRLKDPRSGASWGFSALEGVRFSAFCGIARPWGFKKAMAGLGLVPAAFKAFPDHCPYGPAERDFLEKLLRFTGSQALLSTAKDAVKLKDLKVPLLVLEAAPVPDEPEGLLDAVIAGLARHGGSGTAPDASREGSPGPADGAGPGDAGPAGDAGTGQGAGE